MTVSTRNASASGIQSPNSLATNGNNHSSDCERSFDASALNSQTRDDPINKYARILFEHTRRQMDNATHSIRTRPEQQQSSILRENQAHSHGHAQTSVAW